MRLRNRVLLSLAGSIAAAVLLNCFERLFKSKMLALFELPGLYAFLSIWGVHSGRWNSVEGIFVWLAVNSLAYWPVIFALSFLVRPS